MFGLIVILIMAAYLLLSIAVVKGARRYARKNGKSVARWSWGAALVMYLIPFWDWLPTVATHQYYCATEAGFWVYKTPEQWKQENPGVMETLVYKKNMPHVQTPHGGATILNQRFLYIFRHEGPIPVNRWKIETEIRDSKTDEIIAREITFSTSQQRRQAGWSGWKFWLDSERCNSEKHRDQGSFGEITAQLEGTK